MKQMFISAARVALVSVFAFTPLLARAEKHSGQVLVQAVNGAVTCSSPKGVLQRVGANDKLDCGVVIRTGPDATADLVLGYNRTVLRLTPNSELRVAQLDEELAAEDVVTEITLELNRGALAGSQRKLTLPSRLEVVTPVGTARIMGTEYYVRADGAVSVVSGTVKVQYTTNKGHGSPNAWVTVPAGYSFDPATRAVVPTRPAYLQNIIAHIEVTRVNSETTFKLDNATLTVKTEEFMSPTKPDNGHGHGDDGHGHGGHGDDGHGHGGHGDDGHGHDGHGNGGHGNGGYGNGGYGNGGYGNGGYGNGGYGNGGYGNGGYGNGGYGNGGSGNGGGYGDDDGPGRPGNKGGHRP